MRPCHRALLLLLVVATLHSCAGPARLARQSDRELKAGHVDAAYDLGRRALEKDVSHPAGRRAMTAAATQLVDRSKARILRLASSDTIAAAGVALELRELRGELARYRIETPADPAFFERERALVEGAAAIEYARGEASLAAHRPKDAHTYFRRAAYFVASFQDVQRRIEEAREQAMTRVAILPFANDVEVPGLARATSDRIHQAMAERMAREGFLFTELVSPDEVYASMTVKELEAPSNETAIRIARGVEADRAVIGRLHGLRSRTDSWSFEYPIFRKVSERDSSGRSYDRWVEERFEAQARQRVVTVKWNAQVLDTRTGAALADRSETVETVARVAWTDFRAEGDCGNYRLVRPDDEHSEHGRRVAARWRECFGSWGLADMLQQAREDRRRSVYRSSYRDEFRADSRKRPVLCGELPKENDMAALALEEVWAPVLAALKELDIRD